MREYVRREKGAKITLGIEKLTTLEASEWYRRVGENADGKRREREREKSMNKERRPSANVGQRKRLPRTRNRSEALLVKVREGDEWLQTYKGIRVRFMVAKEAMCESTGVRCTSSGDILVELKAGVNGGHIALKINEATGYKVLACPLQIRVSVEIRDIDPLESREDLKQDIVSGLSIKNASENKVKSLRAARWGTQAATAVVPATYTTGKEVHMKIRTGLTIATMRVLPNYNN